MDCKIGLRWLSILLLPYLLFPRQASLPEEPDLYPDVHELLRLADASSIGLDQLDDHSYPAESLGRLYARAGYLNDSAAAYRRTKFVPFVLIKALALYGKLPAAEREISAIVQREKKVNAQLEVADVLWRMGDSKNAERLLSAARISVGGVVDPARRSELYKLISTSAEYVKGDPPSRLSAKPMPLARPTPPISSPPHFPINTEGFAAKNPMEARTELEAKQGILTRLYGMVASENRDGLICLITATAEPFQKALVLASFEHLLIQADQPDIAESYATQMPETTSECRLVKAEALSAAAAAHLRHQNEAYAVAGFDAAAKLVTSAEDLPFGQVQVFTEIAREESQEPASAALVLPSLQSAETIASKLPVFIPRSVSTPQRPVHKIRQYYRHEALELVLQACAQTGQIDFAREVADKMATAGPWAASRVVGAWWLVGEKAEAIRFAQKLTDPAERVKAILSLAGSLLNDAGAPNI